MRPVPTTLSRILGDAATVVTSGVTARVDAKTIADAVDVDGVAVSVRVVSVLAVPEGSVRAVTWAGGVVGADAADGEMFDRQFCCCSQNPRCTGTS